jgi:hypothetical protein
MRNFKPGLLSLLLLLTPLAVLADESSSHETPYHSARNRFMLSAPEMIVKEGGSEFKDLGIAFWVYTKSLHPIAICSQHDHESKNLESAVARELSNLKRDRTVQIKTQSDTMLGGLPAYRILWGCPTAKSPLWYDERLVFRNGRAYELTLSEDSPDNPERLSLFNKLLSGLTFDR